MVHCFERGSETRLFRMMLCQNMGSPYRKYAAKLSHMLMKQMSIFYHILASEIFSFSAEPREASQAESGVGM